MEECVVPENIAHIGLFLVETSPPPFGRLFLSPWSFKFPFIFWLLMVVLIESHKIACMVGTR